MPKRSSERRRRNADGQPAKAVRSGEVIAPEPPRRLHPVALAWYESLKESGQSDYFEPSDWAAAQYVALVITKNLRAKQFSSVLFASVWSAMGDLLTTEQARRRARIEVERDMGGQDERAPGITVIDEYRRMVQ